MTLYNLILQDTVIEDIELDEAMDIARMYVEIETKGKQKIQNRNYLPIGYEYRLVNGNDTQIIATIELSKD